MIADATFIDADDRALVEHAAHATGARFVGLWLEVPIATLEARITARRGDASDATLAVLHSAAGTGAGAGRWVTIDANQAEMALEEARSALA